MIYSNINSQTLGFLGRALSLEMTAVQQYLTMSRLLKLRGFEEEAKSFQEESQHEMEHVEQIVNRMLVMGVAPNATQLRPVRLGNSLPELIANVQAMESEIVEFYKRAVAHCRDSNDFDNQVFFEKLLKDELEHVDSLEAWKGRYSKN